MQNAANCHPASLTFVKCKVLENWLRDFYRDTTLFAKHTVDLVYLDFAKVWALFILDFS